MKTDYKFGEVLSLTKQVATNDEKVGFRNIFEMDNGGISMLSFKAGQRLGVHTAPAEVMIYVIDGDIEFTMIDKSHMIKTGEFILMGADVPHSVKANADSKVLLVKIKN